MQKARSDNNLPPTILPSPLASTLQKVAHLEHKAQFFEGQVDPLISENLSLKDQVTTLSK